MHERTGSELDFLTRVAWYYYKDGMTQADVAAHLGVSRATVVRALREVHEQGIVQIDLCHPMFEIMQMENELKQLCRLQDAVVVPTGADGRAGALTEKLGKAGALYLRKQLQNGTVVATAWGVTLWEVSRRVRGRPLKDFSVVMLLGGLTGAMQSFNPTEIARTVAQAFHGRCYPLCAPALVDSPIIRDVMLTDRGISSALEMARSADMALVGIGSTGEDASVIRAGVLSAGQVKNIRDLGGEGDIAYRYFDAGGRPVVTEADERIIGLSLAELRQIPQVIAVAGGASKVKAIAGAIRGEWIDVLITDECTARDVLNEIAPV